jgi:hypothetical protein
MNTFRPTNRTAGSACHKVEQYGFDQPRTKAFPFQERCCGGDRKALIPQKHGTPRSTFRKQQEAALDFLPRKSRSPWTENANLKQQLDLLALFREFDGSEANMFTCRNKLNYVSLVY